MTLFSLFHIASVLIIRNNFFLVIGCFVDYTKNTYLIKNVINDPILYSIPSLCTKYSYVFEIPPFF